MEVPPYASDPRVAVPGGSRAGVADPFILKRDAFTPRHQPLTRDPVPDPVRPHPRRTRRAGHSGTDRGRARQARGTGGGARGADLREHARGAGLHDGPAGLRHGRGAGTWKASPPIPELRAAHNAVEPLASEFYSSIPLDEGLWKALREYAATPEAAALEGVRRRFLTKTIDSFRRHGAELDPAGKARLAEIDVELSKLTTRFAQNVLDCDQRLRTGDRARRAKLAGLPPSAVAAARQSAAARRAWRAGGSPCKRPATRP